MARTAYEWGVVAEVVPNGNALSRAQEFRAAALEGSRSYPPQDMRALNSSSSTGNAFLPRGPVALDILRFRYQVRLEPEDYASRRLRDMNPPVDVEAGEVEARCFVHEAAIFGTQR
jgi:hypothetical protein